MATETYALAAFTTSGGVVAPDALEAEIVADPAIPIQIVGVTVGASCYVEFQAALDAGQKAALDALVAAHTGVPLPDEAILVDVKGPREDDGKQVVVISPATIGFKTWLTSFGDDLAASPPGTGRGKGTRLHLAMLGEDDSTVEVEFIEPVEVHDGQLNWTPAAFGPLDSFEMSVYMPPSIATSTPGTGNVNAVPHPTAPGANLYVPAAGNGSHTIDLAKRGDAILLPARDPSDPEKSIGYWDADPYTGVISPSATPGTAKWFLGDFATEAWLIPGVVMFNSKGLFDVDVYKVEIVWPGWKLRLKVSKASAGPGDVSGWLLLFRKDITRV